MKKLQLTWTVLLLLTMLLQVNGQSLLSKPEMIKLADKTLDFAARQYRHMAATVPDSLLPRSTNKDGSLMTSTSSWWTCGFYPGTLWYLYEYTKEEAIKQEAIKRMALVENNQYNTRTHDLGFMMYCPFGNAYRFTKDPEYKTILLKSAASLATRFNPAVGCIKSWDHGTWKFPVIIDNMMNLELLTWASRESGDPSFANIATTHANTTMKHHFRKDFSSWHVIDYNPATGAVVEKKTHQGFSDSSAWARGQAWGLYGYVMMYRETKQKIYLDQARHIADFMLNHPNMPADLIPYWDFNATGIPNVPRDVSAGAVTAAALLELSRYTGKKEAKRYWNAAEKMIVSLASPAYLAKEGGNNNFILMHSVGSLPHNSEVDVPLTYADYYFVEALLRYKAWVK